MPTKKTTEQEDADLQRELEGADKVAFDNEGDLVTTTAVNEPDATGSTSGIPAIGPTDTNGDGEPDAGVEEGREIRDRYLDAAKADAEYRDSQAPQQGPEGRRRVNSLAEALYPDENVSDEAKQAVAPKADASHA